MDRETRELLDSLEKQSNRQLTNLSRVLAADGKKADDRVRMIVLAQRETTTAVWVASWFLAGVVTVATVAALLWWHR